MLQFLPESWINRRFPFHSLTCITNTTANPVTVFTHSLGDSLSLNLILQLNRLPPRSHSSPSRFSPFHSPPFLNHPVQIIDVLWRLRRLTVTDLESLQVT